MGRRSAGRDGRGGGPAACDDGKRGVPLEPHESRHDAEMEMGVVAVGAEVVALVTSRPAGALRMVPEVQDGWWWYSQGGGSGLAERGKALAFATRRGGRRERATAMACRGMEAEVTLAGGLGRIDAIELEVNSRGEVEEDAAATAVEEVAYGWFGVGADGDGVRTDWFATYQGHAVLALVRL